jgi:hypothetical protein
VPVQVGHDSVARLPEPVALSELHEQELPQRSVCLAGLAWSPPQRPDARDSRKQTADGSVRPLAAAVSALSSGECAARVLQRVPPAKDGA